MKNNKNRLIGYMPAIRYICLIRVVFYYIITKVAEYKNDDVDREREIELQRVTKCAGK